MCQNLGKQEIVGTNGMPKFFFSRGSIAILIGGFSKSKFTNPSIDNFEHDGLSEYLQWKNSHVCLSGKSNTWILISLLN
jgi:hypothetical protein